jgi:hypothetical protein
MLPPFGLVTLKFCNHFFQQPAVSQIYWVDNIKMDLPEVG